MTLQAMKKAAATDPAINARFQFHRYRVREELYRVDTDPDALHNLAADPAYASTLVQLRQRMRDLMAYNDDPLRERYLATEGAV